MELIKRHAAEFDISKYQDEYNIELMKIIHAKAKGKKPKVHKLTVEKTKSTDLLEQLKASLG